MQCIHLCSQGYEGVQVHAPIVIKYATCDIQVNFDIRLLGLHVGNLAEKTHQVFESSCYRSLQLAMSKVHTSTEGCRGYRDITIMSSAQEHDHAGTAFVSS